MTTPTDELRNSASPVQKAFEYLTLRDVHGIYESMEVGTRVKNRVERLYSHTKDIDGTLRPENRLSRAKVYVCDNHTPSIYLQAHPIAQEILKHSAIPPRNEGILDVGFADLTKERVFFRENKGIK